MTLNTVNRKIYVGVHKTSDPYTFDGYLGCGVFAYTKTFKTKYPFQSAVRRYGADKFERITLGVFNNAEEAYLQESKIVTQDFIRRKDTYNLALGGIRTANYTKEVLQYTLDGKYVKKWDSLTEVAVYFGKNNSNALTKCLRGKVETYLNYQWRYYTEDFPLVIPPAAKQLFPVYQYDLDGYLIKEWKSKHAAAKTLDLQVKRIHGATQHFKQCGGYQWRHFINEVPDKINKYVSPTSIVKLKDNVIIETFESHKDAVEAGYPHISNAIAGKVQTAYGFKWMYLKDFVRL